MNLFVLQCLSGKEDLVRKKLSLSAGSELPEIFIPRRKMKIRRGGRTLQEEYVLFPGYLFFHCESVNQTLVQWCREIPEALRFLPDNREIQPLRPDERELLSRLLFQGEIIGDSAVRFNTNNRIEVVRGPLKGFEGQIIKVNRRKGRAKVRLDMYDRSFEVDFSFFDIEKSLLSDSSAMEQSRG